MLPPTDYLESPVTVTSNLPDFLWQIPLHPAVAVLPPLLVVTVIVALPAPTKVTVPPLTFATLSLLLDHLTLLSAALSGLTWALSVALSYLSRRLDGLNDTPVTPPGRDPDLTARDPV